MWVDGQNSKKGCLLHHINLNLGDGFKHFLFKGFGSSPLPVGYLDLSQVLEWYGFVWAMGDAGTAPQWGIDISTLFQGQCVSFTMDVITVDRDQNVVVGMMFPGRALVRVFGPLQWDPAFLSLTILDGTFQGGPDIPQFQIHDPKQVLGHKVLEKGSMYSVVETCSGMGVATYGFEEAGLNVVLANDMSKQMLEAFQTLHPGIATVEGDICNVRTLREMHAAAPNAAILAAGFSCQPFSPGGRQLGALDTRALTLPGVLRAALLLRKPVVILECVVRASTNRFVRAQLESFCPQCSYSLAEVPLKLEDVWVSKRERWWCVLSVLAFGPLTLRGFPLGSFPLAVKDIMPRTMPMSDEDFDQLLIKSEEHKELRQYCELGPAR